MDPVTAAKLLAAALDAIRASHKEAAVTGRRHKPNAKLSPADARR
jgi:hypothetical protein